MSHKKSTQDEPFASFHIRLCRLVHWATLALYDQATKGEEKRGAKTT